MALIRDNLILSCRLAAHGYSELAVTRRQRVCSDDFSLGTVDRSQMERGVNVGDGVKVIYFSATSGAFSQGSGHICRAR